MLKRLRETGCAIKQIPNRLRYPKPSATFNRLGSTYGGWWIEAADLDEHSKVISAGVGEDITFDLALIEQFDCNILAFDPTPKAVAYAAQFQTEARFQFEACGLADKDGDISLVPPENPNYASYSVADSMPSQQSFTFSAKSLKTILAETGWDAIDLIKMDIEGSEYGVIDSIVVDQIPIQQLCVEFHDNIAGEIGRRTKDSIKQLANYGLKLVYKEYHNYTFLLDK